MVAGVVHFGDLTPFEQAVGNPSLDIATLAGLRMSLLAERAREEGELAAVRGVLEVRREHIQFLVDRLGRRMGELGAVSGVPGKGKGVATAEEMDKFTAEEEVNELEGDGDGEMESSRGGR